MKHIFLDLDNTLISSEIISLKNRKQQYKIFNHHKMDDYIVCERPYLEDFLNFIFKHFKVHVWTASSKDYATFIINNIILKNKNRKVHFVFFDKHCEKSKIKTGYVKKLNMLWKEWNLGEFSENNTFILDDLREVFEAQPNNCMAVHPFSFLEKNSWKDNELLNVKKKLKSLFNI